jgi:Zn-finger protein
MYCGEPIVWYYGLGWMHREDGRYVRFCKDCGWRGMLEPSSKQCPNCGSKRLREDHFARPVYEKETQR